MRYTRQELKQDKFAETAKEAVHWTVAHRSTIVNSVIGLLAAIAIVAGVFWYRDHRNTTASQQLGDALLLYNAPIGAPPQGKMVTFNTVAERATAAKKEFYRISNDYGSTRSGQLAHYFAALSEVDLGNYKVAEDQMKDVAKSHDADVSSLAKLALASIYRSQGKDADATAVYKELIESPSLSVPKTTAQLALADLYEAKQPAEAKKLYQQVAKDDPKGPAGQLATARDKAITQ